MGGGESPQTILFTITMACVVQGDARALQSHPSSFPLQRSHLGVKMPLSLSLSHRACGQQGFITIHPFRALKALETAGGVAGGSLTVTSGQVPVAALRAAFSHCWWQNVSQPALGNLLWSSAADSPRSGTSKMESSALLSLFRPDLPCCLRVYNSNYNPDLMIGLDKSA